MNPSQPSALANWMLRHLLLSNQNEALEGDLLEEFQRRNSVAWYWRQVLGAIVASVAGELRQHWKLLSLETAFVWVWTYYSLLFLRFAQERFWALAFEPHGHLYWWVLSRCSGVLSAALPVVVYLTLTRFNNFRGVLCGISAGIVASQISALLGFGLGLPSGASWSARWPVVLYGSLPAEAAGILPYGGAFPWWLLPCAVLRQSAPLLLAVWVAQLWGRRGQATNFQIEGK